ncbi:hypothetical protein F4778DRAFT_748569 [Xylariomycetidae sp. FL2044]|nr:hypothetical protein F4778DRAFT_748569 [Xylariomycetidae sp. FL2044]
MTMDTPETTPPQLHPDRISEVFLNFLIVSTVLLATSIVCLVLRFVHRIQTRQLWWDDWAVLGATVIAIATYTMELLICLPSYGGAGYHVNTYEESQLALWAKLSLAADVLYTPSTALSKISILLFYWRIFAIDPWFRLTIQLLSFLIAAHCIASVFGLLFAVHPVEAQWNFHIARTSIDTKAFYISRAVINIFLDATLIITALVKLWQLQLNRRSKLLLSIVFLLGSLTIVSSILRIYYLRFIDPSDPTYTTGPAAIWYGVELFLSLICACLRINYSLFKARQERPRTAKPKTYASSRLTSWHLPSFGRTSTRTGQNAEGEELGVLTQGSGYLVISESDSRHHQSSPADQARVQGQYSEEQVHIPPWTT